MKLNKTHICAESWEYIIVTLEIAISIICSYFGITGIIETLKGNSLTLIYALPCCLIALFIIGTLLTTILSIFKQRKRKN